MKALIISWKDRFDKSKGKTGKLADFPITFDTNSKEDTIYTNGIDVKDIVYIKFLILETE